MRKTDLSNLIKSNKGYINWKKSIGKTIPFVYDKVIGELIIIDYNKNKILVQFADKKQWLWSTNIIKCNIGKFVSPIQYKYQPNDNIANEHCDYTIKDRETRIEDNKNIRYYKYHCNVCGWDNGWINEYNIDKGCGCSCCSGFTAVKGINTIGDSRPDLIKYFINSKYAFKYSPKSNKKIPVRCHMCGYIKYMSVSELNINGFYCNLCNSIGIKKPELVEYFIDKLDAYKYTFGSKKKVYIKCPNCNNILYKSIQELYKKGIVCNKCSDGISYPEKIFINIFEQLHIKYVRQLSSTYYKWCEKYKYDFYLIDYNCIIEVNGKQHYEEVGFFTKGGKTLNQEQQNDKVKKETAIKNGVEYYISIDCRESNIEYIKKSILNSILNKIINIEFDNINWSLCNEFARKSIIKEVCDLWNSTDVSVGELCELYNMSRHGIRKYLKFGTELNWCLYDKNDSYLRSKIFIRKKKYDSN